MNYASENFEKTCKIVFITLRVIFSIFSVVLLLMQKPLFNKIFFMKQTLKIPLLLISSTCPGVFQYSLGWFSSTLNENFSKIFKFKEMIRMDNFNWAVSSTMEATIGLAAVIILYIASFFIKKKLDKTKKGEKEIDLNGYSTAPLTKVCFQWNYEKIKFKKKFIRNINFEILLQTFSFIRFNKEMQFDSEFLKNIDIALFSLYASYSGFYLIFAAIISIISIRRHKGNKKTMEEIENQLENMKKAKMKTIKISQNDQYLGLKKPRTLMSKISEIDKDKEGGNDDSLKNSIYDKVDFEEKYPFEKNKEIIVGKKMPKPSKLFFRPTIGRRGSTKVKRRPIKMASPILDDEEGRAEIKKKKTNVKDYKVYSKVEIKDKNIFERIDQKFFLVFSFDIYHILTKNESLAMVLLYIENSILIIPNVFFDDVRDFLDLALVLSFYLIVLSIKYSSMANSKKTMTSLIFKYAKINDKYEWVGHLWLLVTPLCFMLSKYGLEKINYFLLFSLSIIIEITYMFLLVKSTYWQKPQKEEPGGKDKKVPNSTIESSIGETKGKKKMRRRIFLKDSEAGELPKGHKGYKKKARVLNLGLGQIGFSPPQESFRNEDSPRMEAPVKEFSLNRFNFN